MKALLGKVLMKEAENSIEEISLGKACKILHLGEVKVKKLVRLKQLNARVQDGRYRFRISDIFKFQNEQSFEYLEEQSNLNEETIDDLQEKFFGYRTKHRKAVNR